MGGSQDSSLQKRIVVIGGGFGGLAAAVRLLAAGHQVTVVEQGASTGGRARQFRVNGFQFDAGPTVLTAPHLFEELFHLAGERLHDHVDLMPLDPFYRFFSHSGERLDHWHDRAQFLTDIERLSAADREGARRLVDRTSRLFSAFHPYTERPMMRLTMMLAMFPYVVRHRALESVRRMVRRHVRHPFLRSSLEFHPLLIGGNPARTPALYGLIAEFERRWGVHYARGGTAALVRALTALVLRLGGEIRLNSPVAHILTRNGAVAGVSLTHGGVVPADVVVSNVDPHRTRAMVRLDNDRLSAMRRNIDSVRSHVSRLLATRGRPSMSLFVFYFGTNRTWPDSDLAHHSVLIPQDYDHAIAQVFSRRAAITGTQQRFFYVHMPTRTDQSVAPEGCENLYVLTAAPALHDDTDTSEPLETVRSDVLAALEQHLPGFAKHIAVEHVVTPEYFRDVLGTPHGAAFSLQPTLLQSAWFRPHNRVRGVHGLYLVGAGTHPGAGVPAVLASARIAADLIGPATTTVGQSATASTP
jgi:phytoene desaturase